MDPEIIDSETKKLLVTEMATYIASKRRDNVSPVDILDSQARYQIERAIYRVYNGIPEFNSQNAVVYEVDHTLPVMEIFCGFKRGCACAQMSPTIEIVGVEIPGEIKEVEEIYKIKVPLTERISSFLRGVSVKDTATRYVSKEVTGKYIVFSSEDAFEKFEKDLPNARMTWRDNLISEIKGNFGDISFVGISVDEVKRYSSGNDRSILYNIFLENKARLYSGDNLDEIIEKAEERVVPIRNVDLENEIDSINPHAYSISSSN
jgi:hypothetical protein